MSGECHGAPALCNPIGSSVRRVARHSLRRYPRLLAFPSRPPVTSRARPKLPSYPRRLSRKGLSSGVVDGMPGWRRTSLKVVVSRGSCYRRT
jgi:hypothetical protein